MLENVVFGVFDDRGNIDADINGRHHALMIDLNPDNAIQYTFRQGKCIVPKIQLPKTHGPLSFQAFHSLHTELTVHIKVDLIPKPQFELLGPPDQDLEDSAVCQAHSNEQITDEMWTYTCSLKDEIMKYTKDLKRLGIKVKQREDNLKTVENHRKALDDFLLGLKGQSDELKKRLEVSGSSQIDQGGHSVEQTLEEIRSQGNSAGSLWVDLSRRSFQSCQVPILEDVVGIVSLLGKLETDLLSRVLSQYLGKSNMLAIVCKSHEGVEALEQYDLKGKIIERLGIHGLASAQNRQINGRFRVICLEDIRSFQGEFKVDDPQKRLNIDEPKLPNGKVPAGFLGYAVNMINLDTEHLCSVTPAGSGLRETLFFHLFSYLQVYETRNHLKQARAYLAEGAISLDGGLVRCKGVHDLGKREEVDVKFPTTWSETTPSVIQRANQVQVLEDTEEQIRQKTQYKETIEEEINHARGLFKCALDKFNEKKRELKDREDRMNTLLAHFGATGPISENPENSD
eukprot:Gb_24289 [translate_table: standard]